ncbi:MAG: hypothetical protein PHR81_04080 [Bacteroidales bacterium]|nr:hypothetical protein [Bacteroidales bacterium]MDD4213970.1 hypothetical protein [Bacteroidales bacterium]
MKTLLPNSARYYGIADTHRDYASRRPCFCSCLSESDGALAIQDAATAKLVYDKALATGVGANIDI